MQKIYRFIDVDKNVVDKKLPSQIYEYLWLPVLTAKFVNCRPREIYIFDCFFSNVLENPYTIMFLSAKAPKNMKLVDSMPVEAKTLRIDVCNASKFSQDLYTIANEVVNEDYSRLYQLIEKVSQFSDVEISYRVFLKTKRYVIPAEKIKEVTMRIAKSSARKVLEHLCCIDKKENRAVKPEVEAEPAYLFAYVAKDFSDSGIVIGKKIHRLKAIAKLVKMYYELYAEKM